MRLSKRPGALGGNACRCVSPRTWTFLSQPQRLVSAFAVSVVCCSLTPIAAPPENRLPYVQEWIVRMNPGIACLDYGLLVQSI